ncbi:MAG: hypothetical protein KDA81_14690 [Planctomycetaceae bacterium]|nr:hypothetical protein [Planctomycetaceae bacterium]
MRTTSFAVASLLFASMTFMGMADTASAKAKSIGEKPADSPGWVVIEEDWWYPLRFDPVDAFDSASYHFRRNEETAAANEIDRAVTWLKYAAGHAMPITKEKLDAAVTDLKSLSGDLRSGNLADAARLDGALGRAAHVLAEWHFFKAKESYGKGEEGDAAQNLEAAVAHLQHAANSAHYQFGTDTITLFETIRRDGRTISETKTIDNNVLGKNIDEVEKAVKELAETLKKTSKTRF